MSSKRLRFGGICIRKPGKLQNSRISSKIAFAIGLSGGAGLSPVWPGTVGAALGLPLAYALQPLSISLQLLAYSALFAVGVWASDRVADETGMDDPQIVVIDETFGCAFTLFALPFDPVWWPAWWIAGFLAFRFFDIVKPWPVNRLQDEIKGGLGIMIDDAAAALQAIAFLWICKFALDAVT